MLARLHIWAVTFRLWDYRTLEIEAGTYRIAAAPSAHWSRHHVHKLCYSKAWRANKQIVACEFRASLNSASYHSCIPKCIHILHSFAARGYWKFGGNAPPKLNPITPELCEQIHPNFIINCSPQTWKIQKNCLRDTPPWSTYILTWGKMFIFWPTSILQQ